MYGYVRVKTLTELSGSVIRVAAAAIAEARRSLPSDEKSAVPAVPEAPAQAAPAATGEAPAQTAVPIDAPATTSSPAPVASPALPPATPGPAAESGAAKEAIDAAVGRATGLSGDRLTMLRGAVEAVGRRAGDVRLVRVFGLEEQVTGATKVGAYQYVVDLFPADMRQVTAPRDERGRGGRGGGWGGGDRGVKGGGSGGFSMDSLREDRKNERGGRGGFGGRRGPGGGGGGGRGGSGGSAGSGGPPGGAPKK